MCIPSSSIPGCTVVTPLLLLPLLCRCAGAVGGCPLLPLAPPAPAPADAAGGFSDLLAILLCGGLQRARINNNRSAQTNIVCERVLQYSEDDHYLAIFTEGPAESMDHTSLLSALSTDDTAIHTYVSKLATNIP